MALTNKLTAIANAIRAKTGKTGALSLDQMVTEISGITTGITPTGTKTITENGTYDVTSYASAIVDVPNSSGGESSSGGGIVPSGTKEITANGEYDITNFANVLVNISGLNAKIFTATVSSDKTSEVSYLTNDWLKSLRSDPNAFVLLRYMGMAASTAQVQTVLTANFPLYYSGATMYNSVVTRATASSGGTNGNTKGLSGGGQYNGHLNIDANGRLHAWGNATYPIKAGTYQIIAGTVEML